MKTYISQTSGKVIKHDGVCQLCGQPDLPEVFDAKMYVGPWAWCCRDCFMERCVGLGIGRGQVYIEVTDDEC
jgi:hypothetical protein